AGGLMLPRLEERRNIGTRRVGLTGFLARFFRGFRQRGRLRVHCRFFGAPAARRVRLVRIGRPLARLLVGDSVGANGGRVRGILLPAALALLALLPLLSLLSWRRRWRTAGTGRLPLLTGAVAFPVLLLTLLAVRFGGSTCPAFVLVSGRALAVERVRLMRGRLLSLLACIPPGLIIPARAVFRRIRLRRCSLLGVRFVGFRWGVLAVGGGERVVCTALIGSGFFLRLIRPCLLVTAAVCFFRSHRLGEQQLRQLQVVTG